MLEIQSFGSTNSDGMIAMDVCVNPPKKGEPSYELWHKEYSCVLSELQGKAKLVAAEMQGWTGVRCA